MARPRSIPTYRRHKQSGQAIVTLIDPAGRRRDILLGKYRSPASRAEYARVVAEWEANAGQSSAGNSRTISELALAFWRWAEQHYRRPDGTQTNEIGEYKQTLRALNHLYGHTLVADFGPLALKAVRELMVKGYDHPNPKYGAQPALARTLINKRINRIRRLVKWGVENEVVPATVLHGLQTVRGLQRGRCDARESELIRPVSRAVVNDTLPLLPPTVADMVQLQLETGMRSGELILMRACDLDMTGKTWLYCPVYHKTAYQGHSRVIAVGPKGQAIIKRHLSTDTQAYLFSPRNSIAEFRAEQRRNRKSKVQPSQQNRAKRKPRKQPGEHYTNASYCRAIGDAIARHNRDKAESEQIPHWHPHQLRHTRATELRREFGLDAARAVLGHRSPSITETYAEIDLGKVIEVIGRVG